MYLSFSLFYFDFEFIPEGLIWFAVLRFSVCFKACKEKISTIFIGGVRASAIHKVKGDYHIAMTS